MLIGTLAMAAGRIVSTDHLIEVLWGDDPPESAVNTLQSYISRLRRLLGYDAIRMVDHGYQLQVDAEDIDALRFERLIRTALDDDCPPAESRALCHEALGLWRGIPFGDLADVDPFRLEALRLDELRMSAMETQLQAELALNHPELVIGALESSVQENPYRERLWFLLIEALSRDGRRREALEACSQLREVLGEVGLSGGARLSELEDRIVQGVDV
jgi:DNA-binding SARP family transcriptional activator